MKPILFNGEMVRAILDGRKTVTRRVIPIPNYGYFMHEPPRVTPRYRPGDILYVRETWFQFKSGGYAYRADSNENSERVREDLGYRWHPSIHMPKEAARIWLRVTDVRVERLQDITEQGAIAEGTAGAYPPSQRHRDKKSKWVSGHCSECIQFNLSTGLATACPGDYEAQQPRDGTRIGCTFGFSLKPDTAYEPPIFQFRQFWDKTVGNESYRYGWNANPWVWVIEFERCEKPEEA